MHSFRTPSTSSSDRFRLADHNGELILFTVRSIERGVRTDFGEKDAAKVDAVVLSGPTAGTRYDDQLIFAQVVRQQLAEAVEESGDPDVLARIGTGTAKAGQSAPWLLIEPSEADERTAQSAAAAPARTATQSWVRTGGSSPRAPSAPMP